MHHGPAWHGAFERLRLEHLAFRRAEPEEMRELEELHVAILTHIAERPGLATYFAEAWSGASSPDLARRGAGPEDIRVVAVMQLRLMERAFLLLRLGRYGNARENRGWMNLFRRWGRSPAFHAVFEELEETLAPELRRFHRDYVHNRNSIEQSPIHHPWQRPAGERARGVFMDSGLMEAEAGAEGGIPAPVRPAAGGIVDAKGPAGPDQPYEEQSGEKGGGSSSGTNQ